MKMKIVLSMTTLFSVARNQDIGNGKSTVQNFSLSYLPIYINRYLYIFSLTLFVIFSITYSIHHYMCHIISNFILHILFSSKLNSSLYPVLFYFLFYLYFLFSSSILSFILFFTILFYSILFYSILFYSILQYVTKPSVQHQVYPQRMEHLLLLSSSTQKDMSVNAHIISGKFENGLVYEKKI